MLNTLHYWSAFGYVCFIGIVAVFMQPFLSGTLAIRAYRVAFLPQYRLHLHVVDYTITLGMHLLLSYSCKKSWRSTIGLHITWCHPTFFQRLRSDHIILDADNTLSIIYCFKLLLLATLLFFLFKLIHMAWFRLAGELDWSLFIQRPKGAYEGLYIAFWLVPNCFSVAWAMLNVCSSFPMLLAHNCVSFKVPDVP